MYLCIFYCSNLNAMFVTNYCRYFSSVNPSQVLAIETGLALLLLPALLLVLLLLLLLALL
jgi:hypothetical protein